MGKYDDLNFGGKKDKGSAISSAIAWKLDKPENTPTGNKVMLTALDAFLQSKNFRDMILVGLGKFMNKMATLRYHGSEADFSNDEYLDHAADEYLNGYFSAVDDVLAEVKNMSEDENFAAFKKI